MTISNLTQFYITSRLVHVLYHSELLFDWWQVLMFSETEITSKTEGFEEFSVIVYIYTSSLSCRSRSGFFFFWQSYLVSRYMVEMTSRFRLCYLVCFVWVHFWLLLKHLHWSLTTSAGFVIWYLFSCGHLHCSLTSYLLKKRIILANASVSWHGPSPSCGLRFGNETCEIGVAVNCKFVLFSSIMRSKSLSDQSWFAPKWD